MVSTLLPLSPGRLSSVNAPDKTRLASRFARKGTGCGFTTGSTLSLFMARVLTDDPCDALSLDDFALFAYFFYRRSDLHDEKLLPI